MVGLADTAIVSMWGVEVGAVSWDAARDAAIFEYMPGFLPSGIEISPLHMALSSNTFSFPQLSAESFKGLPGLLADSLPDKFGSALIDQWLIREGISKEDFTPVQRLCYIGSRGMGALEFRPTIERQKPGADHALDLEALVDLASSILTEREHMQGDLQFGNDVANAQTLTDILQVGVSAGGARAKAVVAWNEASGEVRSGQLTLPPGFQHWLLKFDGVSNNRDKELADGKGYGLMEYAYYQMARAADIDMNECRLLEENNRHHFMSKRFDRTAQGEKLHMQTLAALAHFDFNMPGAYSYEQAIDVAQQLQLGMSAVEQLYKRALFNIMARNQDDHVKNIAFLMDSSGSWRLAPAYDLTYAYNPSGKFTSAHQMSFNGKREDFEKQDFLDVAARFNIPSSRAQLMMEQVSHGVQQWASCASAVGIDAADIEKRQRMQRIF